MNYYTEIETFSKKNDVLSKLKKFNPEIITNDDDMIEIKIMSNYSEELWIEISTEFSIFLGDWHSHYFAHIGEYYRFLDDLLGILENKKSIRCAYTGEHWCASDLAMSSEVNQDEIIERFGNDKTIKCSFWDKSKNFVIN